MSTCLKILSPAKINLCLKVIGKRRDGYHEIVSLMQPISLYDEISISVDDGHGITIQCANKDIPKGEDNLCFKAADLFLKEVGLKRGVSLDITKNIPISAGLGGGSSNAAAVLMGLNGLLKTRLSNERLIELSQYIGSDVAFFILRGSAIATGRGEMLERVKLLPYSYVLVNPGFGVSSGWAYGNLSLTKKHKDNILKILGDFVISPDNVSKILENDLEGVVLREYPVIGGLKGSLMEAGALGSLMSGSGPTVFGIFQEEDKAKKAYSRLKDTVSKSGRVFFAKGL